MKETFHQKEITPEVFHEKGEAKKCLHDLEATGTYVFHGSPDSQIVELEPRQPHDYSTGTKVPHGDPCVAATPYADIAIFRAIVCRDWTHFGKAGDTLDFGASKKALALARKHQRGWVYVLPKEGFLPFGEAVNPMEWRSAKPQKPVRIIEVSFDDLPDNINIIDP